MSLQVDKAKVLIALRERLSDKLSRLTASQQSAQAGSVHEEAKSEHPKDTRATEASYLARGLAERVEALRDAVAMLATLRLATFTESDAVSLTALVVLSDEDDHESVYFLLPVGAGEGVTVSGRLVQSITPASPLGRALVGRYVEDEVEVELPGGKRVCSLVGLS